MKPGRQKSELFERVSIYPPYADIISLTVQQHFEQLATDKFHLGSIVQSLVTDIRNRYEEHVAKNSDSGKSNEELTSEFANDYINSLEIDENSLTGRYLATHGRDHIALSIKHVIWNDIQPMYFQIQNPKFAKLFIDEAKAILNSRQVSAGSAEA